MSSGAAADDNVEAQTPTVAGAGDNSARRMSWADDMADGHGAQTTAAAHKAAKPELSRVRGGEGDSSAKAMRARSASTAAAIDAGGGKRPYRIPKRTMDDTSALPSLERPKREAGKRVATGGVAPAPPTKQRKTTDAARVGVNASANASVLASVQASVQASMHASSEPAGLGDETAGGEKTIESSDDATEAAGGTTEPPPLIGPAERALLLGLTPGPDKCGRPDTCMQFLGVETTVSKGGDAASGEAGKRAATGGVAPAPPHQAARDD